MVKKHTAHHLRILIHQEDEKQAFQRIHFSLKPPRSGVNRVEIENDNGTRMLVCDKEGIEKEIARVNVNKLLQAENTLLRQEPLCSHFGEQGDFKNGIKSSMVHSNYRITTKMVQDYGWSMSKTLPFLNKKLNGRRMNM